MYHRNLTGDIERVKLFSSFSHSLIVWPVEMSGPFRGFADIKLDYTFYKPTVSFSNVRATSG